MEDLMTLQEAADYLRVHRTTLTKINPPARYVPGYKRRRFAKADLNAWMVKVDPSVADAGLKVILH